MLKLLREILMGPKTEADGILLASWLGLLTFLSLEIFSVVVQQKEFDPQAFGLGLGAVIGAGGLAQGFKNRMEKQ